MTLKGVETFDSHETFVHQSPIEPGWVMLNPLT